MQERRVDGTVACLILRSSPLFFFVPQRTPLLLQRVSSRGAIVKNPSWKSEGNVLQFSERIGEGDRVRRVGDKRFLSVVIFWLTVAK